MTVLNNIIEGLTNTSTPPNWTLGVDVSVWNGHVDWSIMKAKNVKFAIIKATDIGSETDFGFVDSRAIENYNGTKANGILNGAYCWLDPKKDPTYQARYYLDNFYSKYPTDLPACLDFEDGNVITWNDMLWKASVWLDIVEKETGRTPIVYTGAGYMAHFDRDKAGFLSRYPLWTAHYIQRTYPTISPIWQDWTIWQYSSSGHYPWYIWRDPLPSRGKEYGCDSYSLDMNYFKGDYNDLLEFCEMTSEPIPDNPEETDIILFDAKCITGGLNIRTGIGTAYPIVGVLRYGDRVSVYEVKSGWFRIGKDKWCSGSYMQKIDSPIIVDPTNPIPDTLYYPIVEGKYPITQFFGERPNVYTTSKGHNGIDWGMNIGGEVYATKAGKVIFSADVKQKINYGRHIRIQHDDGISIYGHLSKRYVEVGDTVQAKQLIGLSGGAADDPYSGYSTGPHLHFEYRLTSGAPQVPGGYVYGAINTLPLLASHNYTEDLPSLFQAKSTIDGLNTRYDASIHAYRNGSLKLGEVVNVCAEKDGWMRISPKSQVWCSGYYMKKIGEEQDEYLFKAKCVVNALNKRSGVGTTYPILGQLKLGDIVSVYQVKDNWFKIDKDTEVWVSGYSQYMSRLQA